MLTFRPTGHLAYYIIESKEVIADTLNKKNPRSKVNYSVLQKNEKRAFFSGYTRIITYQFHLLHISKKLREFSHDACIEKSHTFQHCRILLPLNTLYLKMVFLIPIEKLQNIDAV